ncbi:hypothetical protein [Sphingomonas solaris]|uniref:S-adenosyl-L-homocysteine hydrolase n=1 Tax=Alterirhizorhabdus solaris TaxID=2529389 RepID=A0A558R6R2_9SPHN|nr:hypothetical protein [Sphingomonas solaris]TVV75070.1 hypothetical protein FOY91_08290 [Sphingomonas solaris]
MKMWERAAAACALFGLGLAAPAGAACWSTKERSAAQVRELQTMLMVASLRCRAAGIDITPDYNSFVRAARETIEGANLAIKTHFAAEGGSQADYDRFTTALANAYGDGQTDAATCAEAVETAHAATMTPTEMARLASARLFPRRLPGDTCAIPAEAATAPTIASAPVLRLPDDVIDALTVMARYGTPPAAAAASAPTQLATLTR